MEYQIPKFVLQFCGILYEALPFIVLGAVIAGVLEELVPQRFVVKFLPRSRFIAILIGGLLGLIFPMCECGIIPVMRRLLRKGVPLSACICYMLAGPIINVVVMLATWFAFSGMETVSTPGGGQQLGSVGMVAFRVGLGYLVAVVTSLVVEWQYRKHGNALLAPSVVAGLKELGAEGADEETGPRPGVARRIANISETALHDFVDITVFLILGALLSATVHMLVDREKFATLAANYPLAILIMMGLAIVLCLCSEADAFVAASFGMMPPSAKIAFLVLGPMLDFKLYMMFTRVFRLRLMWTIIPCVVIQVFIYSLIVHWVLQAWPQLVGTS